MVRGHGEPPLEHGAGSSLCQAPLSVPSCRTRPPVPHRPLLACHPLSPAHCPDVSGKAGLRGFWRQGQLVRVLEGRRLTQAGTATLTWQSAKVWKTQQPGRRGAGAAPAGLTLALPQAGLSGWGTCCLPRPPGSTTAWVWKA